MQKQFTKPSAMLNQSSDQAIAKCTIQNRQGLHARTASLFFKVASQFRSDIQIRKGKETVDGKSLLNLLTLGAQEGEEIELIASGADADEAITTLRSLIDNGFQL